MFTKEQDNLLNKQVPKEHILQLTKGGKKLDYINNYFSTVTMNTIFGAGNWSCETIDNELIGEEKNDKGKWKVAYKAYVRIIIYDRESGLSIIKCGTGAYASTSKDRLEAHIMACKAAETDARKRAEMLLGDALGLSFRKSDEEESYEEEHKKYYNADGTEDNSFNDVKTQLEMLCNLYYVKTEKCGYEFAFGEKFADYIKKNLSSIERESAKGKDMHKWFTEAIEKLEAWHSGQKENSELYDKAVSENVEDRF